MAQERDLRHVSFEGKPVQTLRHRRTPQDTGVQPAPTGAVAAPAPAVVRDRDEVAGFARWVLARAGLDAQAYRAESLRRRTPACVRTLKARSEFDARQRLIGRPELLDAALSSLLIGVTAFFRDTDVFDALRERVVPVLAERVDRIRVWSAGCASGDELYSFAILLSEGALLERAYLLGTDCRSDVIEAARTAVHDYSITGADRLLLKYFEAAADKAWRPVDCLRRTIEWKVADVLRGAEAGPWHVIFWRNAAIYLNPGPAAAVCRRLVSELSPGGFLVLGKAERPPSDAGLVPVSRCIYRKRGA